MVQRPQSQNPCKHESTTSLSREMQPEWTLQQFNTIFNAEPPEEY